MTTIASAHDLITAVPFLVGFHPDNSLVLISIHETGIGMTMRIDLPASLQPEEIDLMAHHLLRDNGVGAICVAYVPDSRTDGDSLLIALSAGLTRNGVHVHDAIVVSGGRYRSIICRKAECCAGAGMQLPDFEASHIAAEHVVAGIPMPYESAEAMAQSIAPSLLSIDPDWVNSVAKYKVDELAPNISELQRDGVSAMDLLLDEFRIGVGASDKFLVARVIGRMSDIQVRDFAMGVHREDTFDLYFAMWRELIQCAPTGFIAPIACIVAAMAYESGDGALAHRALDRALGDEPAYPLGLLLRRVFNAGWPPSEFALMREELHPKVITTIFG